MIPQPPVSPLLETKAQEFAQWMHNPLTKGFFQYLGDQYANWREVGAELLEAGAFRLNDPHEDKNPDVVRGKLIAFRDLQGITLEAIQGFYGKEPAVEAEDDKAHE